MKNIIIFLLGLLMFCLPAGRSATVFAQEPAKLKVVATFSILGDMVKNVGGEAIDLTVLVGADGDAHSFEPTPQDGIKLTKADIIIENGCYFEPWINDLYQASQSRAKRVAVTDGVLVSGENVDPHVWHNVQHAIAMVNNIKEALISLDPTHQAIYAANAANYLNELQALEAWVIEQVNLIPQEKRKLVTSHDTFGYFANHYGFEIIGTAIASATTEAAEPSAKQMAVLIEKIKQAGVPVIFTENINSPRLMQMLADEAKVRVAPSLYTDALGQEGSQGDSYIKMMQFNVKTITESLR